MKLKAVGNNHVLIGKNVVAISVLGNNGYTIATLQGMDRDEIVHRIVSDCPEFAKANNVDVSKRYGLFTAAYGKIYLKRYKRSL